LNLSFYIGRRYLFSKKSHNAINIISFISVCGITIATMALVCTLSVFNGFEGMVAGMFSSFDPDLKITPAKGKVFSVDAAEIKKVLKIKNIDKVSQIIEENALLKYGDKQAPVVVKGVSDNFSEIADMKKLMLKSSFILKDGDIDYAVMGIGLAAKLDARREYITPLELYVPIRNVKVNLANPSSAFIPIYLYLGGVFSLNNSKLDENLLIVSIKIARQALMYDANQVSSLAVKLKDGASSESVKKQMRKILGDKYEVKDRFEQQESTFRMMQIEKWVTFFILSFIAIIAIFNVIGSLTMLILEKEGDITTLRSLGANNKTITSIFMIEGWMISFIGAILGVVFGLVLCLLQEHFGLLKLSSSTAQFLINAYPVKVEISDLAIIFSSVVSIGFLAVIYPTQSLRKRLNEKFIKRG
jgi:lipoprotein-releasing system permease protein